MIVAICKGVVGAIGAQFANLSTNVIETTNECQVVREITNTRISKARRRYNSNLRAPIYTATIGTIDHKVLHSEFIMWVFVNSLCNSKVYQSETIRRINSIENIINLQFTLGKEVTLSDFRQSESPLSQTYVIGKQHGLTTLSLISHK